ncbi:Co/Zn/Cd efflux system component [Bradyrhizobium sp. LM6.11]
MQHAVADEPVRAGRVELGIGAVAIERAVQLARQFADDLEERCVGLEWNRREVVAAFGNGVLLHGLSLRIFTS